MTINLGYDAENHLTGITGAVTDSYQYDGDGKRVKETTYENLASGASISSSSALIWPEAVTDGDTYANGGPTAGEYCYSSTGLQSIIVDLGAVYTLDKVKVFHYSNDGRTYHQTKTEVSQDGTTWTTIYDSAVSGEYQETQAGKTLTFTARNVRYIRDWLNGNSINAGNHWIEIEAYGSRTTAFVGNYYEWTGSTASQVKYYSAGSTRVAQRTGTSTNSTNLVWLLGDHLGREGVGQDLSCPLWRAELYIRGQDKSCPTPPPSRAS